jgi:hypothetical protein
VDDRWDPLSEPPVGTPCPDRIPKPQRFLPDSAVAGLVGTAGPSGATGSPPNSPVFWALWAADAKARHRSPKKPWSVILKLYLSVKWWLIWWCIVGLKIWRNVGGSNQKDTFWSLWMTLSWAKGKSPTGNYGFPSQHILSIISGDLICMAPDMPIGIPLAYIKPMFNQ